LSGGQLAFQRLHQMVDVGALLVDFPLQGFRILAGLCIYSALRAHGVFLWMASLSLCNASNVRSGLKCEGSNCFLPACSMMKPMTVTTAPTSKAASQGCRYSDKPYT